MLEYAVGAVVSVIGMIVGYAMGSASSKDAAGWVVLVFAVVVLAGYIWFDEQSKKRDRDVG